MKKAYFFFALAVLSLAASHVAVLAVADTQQAVAYSYDAAGNNTARTIVLSSHAATKRNIRQAQPAETEPSPLVDQLGGQRVDFYPNPTQGRLSVEITGGEAADVQALLLDQQGKRLLADRVQGNRLELDLSPFPAGTYLLVLHHAGGGRNYKIIKQ